VSTSFLPVDADPRAFLDLPEVSLDGALVLVKGSRGMRLERVVDEILRRSRWETMASIVRIGVVGSRRARATAGLLATLLDERSPGRYEVVLLAPSDLALGPSVTGRFRVGVFTDFEHDPASPPHSPEHALALLAQLFMQLPEGGVALLREGDPASDLLAEIVPTGVRAARYEGDVAAAEWLMETLERPPHERP